MMPKTFVVYILSNASHQLYVGVTSRPAQRLWEHRTGAVPGYTARHGIRSLVYWEHGLNARSAIAREKQIKGMRRSRKLALIESTNPEWRDLYEELFPGSVSTSWQCSA
jgi:putative endonuclease